MIGRIGPIFFVFYLNKLRKFNIGTFGTFGLLVIKPKYRTRFFRFFPQKVTKFIIGTIFYFLNLWLISKFFWFFLVKVISGDLFWKKIPVITPNYVISKSFRRFWASFSFKEWHFNFTIFSFFGLVTFFKRKSR